MTIDDDFTFPYNSCHTNEINFINSSDRYFDNINLDDQSNIHNKDNLAPNLRDDDLDINLSNIEECKYLSLIHI